MVLALLWGSGFLWIKLALTGLSPVHLTLVRCALGALTLLAMAFAARQRLPRDGRTWARLIVAAFFCNALPFALFGIAERTVDSGVAGVVAVTILGVFGTGITFYLNYRILSDEGRTAAATVGYLLPVVSVALGALFLGESLTPRVIGGMAVVLVAVGLTRWRPQVPANCPASSAGGLATPK
ncbi:hypothetical protein RAM_42510 [Amycolatopsis mediterranei S699]|uniref:EamA domain-containing protein n=1 Tax=Amycolatopsis mediterranei (strain S699) TaxID=713604 RepID=A0A9R0P633_AMYMS|nr:hypothetical protein RAM_42510 [Amycolatopsis mediterranei S699]